MCANYKKGRLLHQLQEDDFAGLMSLYGPLSPFPLKDGSPSPPGARSIVVPSLARN
jgi:hypothetical protein